MARCFESFSQFTLGTYMSVSAPVSITRGSPPLTDVTRTRTTGLAPPATGYRSISASPSYEEKLTSEYCETLRSSISRYATVEESGDHQYAVLISSSSG